MKMNPDDRKNFINAVQNISYRKLTDFELTPWIEVVEGYSLKQVRDAFTDWRKSDKAKEITPYAFGLFLPTRLLEDTKLDKEEQATFIYDISDEERQRNLKFISDFKAKMRGKVQHINFRRT